MDGYVKYSVPFIKPSFPSAKDVALDYEKIVASNWFTNFGPYEQEFRRKIVEFVERDVYVSTAANATLAIDLAVRALFQKSKEKTQVLVPSFTFAAGPEVLVSNGYTPVFIDIHKDSWQPDIVQAEEYIIKYQDKISGILLCNIFGVGNRRISEWELMAKKYKLPLIIDSAAGFGSQYDKGTYIGESGDCEIFSLHATKPFAVGEGGLIISKSSDFIDKIRSLQNFGFDNQRNIAAIGTNAKLQELNCAIGLKQLNNYEQRLENRRRSLDHYKQELIDLDYQFQDNDELSTIAFVSVLAPNADMAETVYNHLLKSGIEVKRYYTPLHQQSIFNDFAIIADSLNNTEDIASRIISLPLHDNMDPLVIGEITKLIKLANNQ